MAASAPFRVVGTPVPRVEGPDKLTGQAQYTADFLLPGTLWATHVRSPHPHARIVSIDSSRAREVPGVRAVLTAADIPNKLTGRMVKDMPLLCSDTVRCVGDKVAVVAADTVEAAQEGALALSVAYQELPAVFDPLAAMRPGAPIIHWDTGSYEGFPKGIPADALNVCGYKLHSHGNVEQGMAEADLVVEQTFTTPLTHQAYLEPYTCLVALDDDGRVQVWPSNKLPYPLRESLAQILDLDESDIVIHPTVVGGDFGAKGATADVPLAYYVARATGRPVKFIPRYQSDLESLTHRHPSIITMRTGVNRDGVIVARDVHIIFNSGAYGALKPSPDGMLTGADYAAGPYRVPHLRIEGVAVYTNTPPSGYMRAPGHPQVAFATETHMDLVARQLGMDPVEFRRLNAAREAADGAYAHTHEALQAAAEAIGWDTAKAPHVGRGIALVERGMGFGEGAGDVTLNPDGSLTVLTGLPDNGTGALTLIAQIAAEELGVDVERVRVVRGTTDALPIDVGSAADRMTNVAGHAAIAANRKLKEQLTPLAAAMLGAPSAEWDGNGWREPGGKRVSLDEFAMEMVTAGLEPAHARVILTQPANKSRECVAQAAEVEVDPETGQVTLRRIVSVQDTGTVINTLGHQGQIEGGMVQGLGFALSEQLTLEDGRITNGHLGEYKLPTARDVPDLVTINLPSTGIGPYGAKAVGEVGCVPTAPAIANAVADAIGAPILNLPITAESVLLAMES
jgi:carbon-monoxide dehydrogenase large subunit